MHPSHREPGHWGLGGEYGGRHGEDGENGEWDAGM